MRAHASTPAKHACRTRTAQYRSASFWLVAACRLGKVWSLRMSYLLVLPFDLSRLSQHHARRVPKELCLSEPCCPRLISVRGGCCATQVPRADCDRLRHGSSRSPSWEKPDSWVGSGHLGSGGIVRFLARDTAFAVRQIFTVPPRNFQSLDCAVVYPVQRVQIAAVNLMAQLVLSGGNEAGRKPC